MSTVVSPDANFLETLIVKALVPSPMPSKFPPLVTRLPEADIPLKGIKAYLSQGIDHQIIFMEFSEDIDLPEHSHKEQWGFVIDGKIDFTIGGVTNTYVKGDNYHIPEGVKHSGRIHAGLKVMDHFDQPDRYGKK